MMMTNSWIGQRKRGLLATVAPLLAVYRWVAPPEAVGFTLLSVSAALGVLAWLAIVYAVRHPIRHEIDAIVGGIWARLPMGRFRRAG